MKTTLFLAALLQISILGSAQAKSTETGQNFSNFLKHKVKQKPQKSRKQRKRYRKVITRKSVNVRVKVYATKQYTVDLLVTCRRRNILLTYNKIDKKFCTPKFKCKRSLRAAVEPYCSPRR